MAAPAAARPKRKKSATQAKVKVYAQRKETSQDALHSVDHERLREIILRYIISQPDRKCTADAAEAGLGMLHQTCTSQLRFMKRVSWVIEMTEKRPTRTGRGAFVLLGRTFEDLERLQAMPEYKKLCKAVLDWDDIINAMKEAVHLAEESQDYVIAQMAKL